MSDEDVRNQSSNVSASENSLALMSTSRSAAKYGSATPAMELMKVSSYTSVACTRKSCC